MGTVPFTVVCLTPFLSLEQKHPSRQMDGKAFSYHAQPRSAEFLTEAFPNTRGGQGLDSAWMRKPVTCPCLQGCTVLSLSDFNFLLSQTFPGVENSNSVVPKPCYLSELWQKLKIFRSLHTFNFSKYEVGPRINVIHPCTYLYIHNFLTTTKWFRSPVKMCKKLPHCSGL